MDNDFVESLEGGGWRGREGGWEGGREGGSEGGMGREGGGRDGGTEGGEGGREGGREGDGGTEERREGRDDCYTYSNIGMFNSNPMAPQYLNNNYVTYYVIT